MLINIIKKFWKYDKKLGEKYSLITKIVWLVFIVMLLCLLILLTIAYKNKIIRYYNENISHKIIENINLTEEQKLKDFEYLFNVLTTSMPTINQYDELYINNFIDKKDEYIKNIIQTKTDYEYYCVLNGIMADIPSAHTFLMYPQYENYTSVYCYNRDNVLGKLNIKSYTDYWTKLLDDVSNSKYQDDFLSFAYIDGDGKYYFNEKSGIGRYSNEYDNTFITDINGINIDEFILSNLFYIKINYDHINKKPFRSVLIFGTNSDYGKPAIITFEKMDGTNFSKTLYYSCQNDFNILNGINFDNNYTNPADEEKRAAGAINVPYYFYDDNDNDILYAYISGVASPYGEIINEYLINNQSANVILDLRENSGGSQYDFNRFLYSPLFQDDIDFCYNYYTPESKTNKRNIFFENIIFGVYQKITLFYKYADNSKLPQLAKECEYIENTVNFKCIGNQKIKKNVYLLISGDTKSAADTFTSIIKSKTNAVIIGTNTKGEGMGESFVIDMLPNSKLVFSYYPSIALNLDGTNNSVFGTSPNIYIASDFHENLSLKNHLINESYDHEDVFSYDNRILWDNQLKYTVDLIIKENENKQTTD